MTVVNEESPMLNLSSALDVLPLTAPLDGPPSTSAKEKGRDQLFNKRKEMEFGFINKLTKKTFSTWYMCQFQTTST